MLAADLIREFCREKHYEVCENYQKTTPVFTLGGESWGGEPYTTIGIAVKRDFSPMAVAAELGRYMEAKGFDDLLIFEGTAVDELDPERFVVYFPAIEDYQPPQP